jgi:hypothetical protein
VVPRLEWYSRRPQGSQSEGRFNELEAFTVAGLELILLSRQPCDVPPAPPQHKRFQLSGNPLGGSVEHREKPIRKNRRLGIDDVSGKLLWAKRNPETKSLGVSDRQALPRHAMPCRSVTTGPAMTVARRHVRRLLDEVSLVGGVEFSRVTRRGMIALHRRDQPPP